MCVCVCVCVCTTAIHYQMHSKTSTQNDIVNISDLHPDPIIFNDGEQTLLSNLSQHWQPACDLHNW